MIPDLGVIIAAGGSSQRYGEKDKLTEMLGSLPVLLHSVKNFSPLVAPGNLIVAARSEALDEYAALAAEYLPDIAVHFVAGGRNRTGSVRNALAALPLSCGIVAVHDAARPLAGGALLERLVCHARACGGAIAASAVVDSLKLADENGRFIAAPVSRERMFQAETPQVFDLNSFRQAYSVLGDNAPTDDAEVMRLAGYQVELVKSGQWNMKLTSPEDLDKLKKFLEHE
ncbi:MAG: 2-C-methyl-D-erythritol 4-phosphate cytidylyltransferase [Lentisphaeria bacterium]|nr:2-C-methyl-D-erythritol 4-phosphate cytidylyltransferase [Lentisphaeria bacterium]